VGHAKAYVLTDAVRAHGEAHGGGEGEVCGRPGGGGKGGLRVFFLDESGFGLSLPPTYAWARKGEAVRVPRAWGKSGRVNAVAHLERRSCGGWGLGYALLEGRCETGA
jgi:putative transposase